MRTPESIKLGAEQEGDAIIVTLPRTAFRVVYRKAALEPRLVAFDLRGDRQSSISMPKFLAEAWRLANDTARKLGWIG